MTDRTAHVIGAQRGTTQAIARAFADSGDRVITESADDAPLSPPDRVALVLNAAGAGATTDSLVAAGLAPFRDMLDRHAATLRSRGGAIVVVVLLPPAPDLWQQMMADWIAAGIARCATGWAAAGPRINGIIAVLDDSPALPRFLAPRPAATHEARPADVAAAAVAFCADSAAAITGQVLRMGTAAG
jgi:hypothetical protein